MMKLTILGYYGAYPHDGVGTSAYLLEKDGFALALDFGSGAFLALEKHVPFGQVDAVLLSHFHHDHTADVGVLQYARQLNGFEDLLPIYGHSALGSLLVDGVGEEHLYADGETFEIGPFKIKAFRGLHPVECYGFVIDDEVVFSNDTGYFDGLAAHFEGAKLGVFDSYNANPKAHLMVSEIIEIAEKAGVEKVLLTHLPQAGLGSVELPANFVLASDVEVIEC
ncbi:MAG: MBL fold metallo-hydrolase [Lactobacillales bacterium]|jgi:ribonuclease BN (tRNA processing enzyme)|nr:MBL fold metallo-hydrolase [Lactobacillales bacterium]